MTDLLDLIAARAERDTGMQRAKDHADRVHDGWSGEAYSHLISFARVNEFFLAEQMIAAAPKALPPAPDKRAWGAVVSKAARAGIIRRAGYAQAGKTRHAGIATRWESRIYQEVA